MQQTFEFDNPETLEACEKYDAEHPDVWVKFRNLALRIIRRGFEHYSAKTIYEVMRFHTSVRTGETPKLNNNYTAYYARKFMREFPEHAGFFETRKARIDNAA